MDNHLSTLISVGSKQPGQMNMRKGGTPNPMTAAGKLEHAIVFQTIEEMISPRLSGEVSEGQGCSTARL